MKHFLKNLARKALGWCDTKRTKAYVAYGRFFNKGDKWIISKVLDLKKNPDTGKDLIISNNINNIYLSLVRQLQRKKESVFYEQLALYYSGKDMTEEMEAAFHATIKSDSVEKLIVLIFEVNQWDKKLIYYIPGFHGPHFLEFLEGKISETPDFYVFKRQPLPPSTPL